MIKLKVFKSNYNEANVEELKRKAQAYLDAANEFFNDFDIAGSPADTLGIHIFGEDDNFKRLENAWQNFLLSKCHVERLANAEWLDKHTLLLECKDDVVNQKYRKECGKEPLEYRVSNPHGYPDNW